MSGVQLLGLVSATAILLTLFELMRRHRLREKYAVIWVVLAVGALVVALFPPLLTAVTEALGLRLPSNLLFLVASLVLLGLSLQYSFELGRSEDRVRTLAEEVALLRLRLEELEKESGGSDPLGDH